MSVQAAAALLEMLRRRGLTLATAESLTGGELGALLTSVPGASDVYVGGVVSYATRVKVSVLHVPQDLVDRHGVVSANCAQAMAEGARRVLRADLALSTTGVAGPDPQEGRPVGTVFVAAAGPSGMAVRDLLLMGDRAAVRTAACAAAIALAPAGVDGPGALPGPEVSGAR